MSPKLEAWEKLRQIRTFAQLFQYLKDDLEWPIAVDDLEDEPYYDWDPTELGLAPEQAPTLHRIRQLQPLTAKQPWGIFFLEFTGTRLPITPLRRLLQGLVTKKRAKGDGSRKTWGLDDLLFIVTTDSGDAVELHFLAFFEADGPTPELRSLPWRPVQSPDRYLRRVATELLPHLEWPDDEADTNGWRAAWQEAFVLRPGATIRGAATLAERMADVAKALRDEIASALEAEKGKGLFTDLLGEIKKQLVATADAVSFADMCAQTLVYGVLTSRITDPEAFGASPVLTSVPLSNPFLSAFFDDIHDQATVLDLDRIGLEQLVADLRESDVESMLDQFGSSARGGDPVIHFYEVFLQRYDRKMRADAGAFYTPRPVVEFMTRTVDSLLRDRFGLRMGLADPGSWADVAASQGFDIPSGVDPSAPFVSMVDPATGTGTFVVEWLRRARASYLSDGGQLGSWPDHLQRVVLPSIHAFELMLGPYAIAHLKVALELHDDGAGEVSPAILLTNTLDHDSHTQSMVDDPVSTEGQRAADLKHEGRFTVCIGNPPYDREQLDPDDPKARRKGGVARYGAPGINPLMASVLEPLKAAGLGKHAKNAYNDYVYFWTWAIWQTVAKKPGPGVVAFITASSYLDGVSLGGLRAHLRDSFDELWIVDLGGEGRGARIDENVFDILTPVSIAFGVRTGRPHKGCEVRYLEASGTRAEKFDELADLELNEAQAQIVHGDGLAPLTPRSEAPYRLWPEVTDVFPWIHSGCQVKRTWPIGPSKTLLERRWSALLEAAPSARKPLFKETRDRTTTSGVRALLDEGRLKPLSSLKAGTNPERIVRYGYRSLDRQWLIADNRVADYPRPPLWRGGKEQIFLTTLTSTKLGRGPVVTATPYVPDLDHFSGRGAKNAMPLHRDARGAEPNITGGLLDVLTASLGREVDAKRLAAYVYGLTGTAAFAERFTDELGEGAGPVRLPFTADAQLFEQVADLGADLLHAHCWGERFGDGRAMPTVTAREVSAVSSYPERFTWDAASEELRIGSGVIGPVAQAVWEFEVSGLKVLQSWLGYRMKKGKGKKSSPLDDIRPERWTFTDELLLLLSILEFTVASEPRAAELLDQVVTGELIDPSRFPVPSAAERKAPRLS